jgi:predicted dehydrogenase/nucleoside-diphosphate-sugar epimerase
MAAAPRFRLAIIGTGEAAGNLHLPAALASELIEVTALVDPVVERAKSLASKYGLRPQIGTCIDDISGPVDGAVIATPNDTHRDLAVACAAKRIHCLVEKPLATSVAAAEQICRAAAEHGIVLAVGYAMRFRNEVVLLKRLLDSGYFGEIQRFHIQHGSLGGWSPVSRYNLDRSASGGGVLVVSGTHFLDLVLYWFGYPEQCEMLDDAAGGPEAHCLVRLRYRQFDGTIRLSKLFKLDPGVVIETDRGRVVMGGEMSPLLFRPRQDPQLQIRLEARRKPRFPPGVSNFQLELEDFVAACRDRRPPLVDGEQGLLSVRLLDQLYSRRKALSEPEPRIAGPLRRTRASAGRSESTKVAVFGASGFVGSALVERLRRKGIDVAAAIHSAGNAWRLARYGIPLRSVDVMSPTAIAEFLDDATHVVNCTRGPDDVMIRGLKNILTAAAAHRVRRFVHLSSVAVYGDPPPPEAAHEESIPRPAPASYGALKLQQDQLVARAHARGLSCVILCPPNITGVYSPFLCGVIEDLRRGSLALVDEGRMPVNVVDVENLCHAIELALCVDSADGRRMFITDDDSITWQNLADELRPLAELVGPLPSLPRSAVVAPDPAARRISLWKAMRHLVSSEVRSALRTDPLFDRLEATARVLIKNLPGQIEHRLRINLGGDAQICQVPTAKTFGSRYVWQQLRAVVHSCERAKGAIGFSPVIEFRESMARFRSWYIATRGMEMESWPLARELF